MRTHGHTKGSTKMDTRRGVLNTGVYWGKKGRASGGGELGRDSLEKNARYR